MIASSAGHIEIVKVLLTAGVDVNMTNDNGQTALHYAASRNREDIAKCLLEAGAHINAADKLGNTSLHRAASRGHLSMVKLLLTRSGITIDALDSAKNTPLYVRRLKNNCYLHYCKWICLNSFYSHLAVDEERVEVCTLLISAGASVNIQNKVSNNSNNNC